MFGALKRFLSEKIQGSADQNVKNAEVSDPEFWPQMIARCGKEFPELVH